MNLADMLSYADIHELSRIARNYDCAGSTHSKNELIQSILSTLGRREWFESLVANLEQEDVRFLNALLFDRRKTFSLEELMARASLNQENKEEPAVNPRELISRFKQRGWLFSGYSQQTKYLFQVPEDLKKRFSETLGRVFSRKLVYADGPPRVYRDEQDMLPADILAFLRLLGKQELPLNAEGFLYKRQLQHLLESMAISEEQVAKTAWRFGYGRRFREYPIRFSFLYDYCYYQGYIEEQGTVLRLTLRGEAAVEQSKKEDVAALYGFWMRLYRGPVPNLASIVHWIGELGGPWVTTASLADVICPLMKPYYYDTPRDIFEQRLVPMLTHLGMMRIGADEEYGSLVQTSVLGKSVIKGTYVPEEETIHLPE